jgi:transketolase C-terminal domain/subunit
LLVREIANVRVVSISCPQQLLAFMRWVMEGGRGLVYARVLRAPAPVLHDREVRFELGRGYRLRGGAEDRAVIVSSGRGVHEALKAADLLAGSGVPVGVIDMPSVDTALLGALANGRVPLLFAEQNNGYLWSEFQKVCCKQGLTFDRLRWHALNTLDEEGNPRFIHSATYPELVEHFGLSPERLAGAVERIIAAGPDR